MNKYFKFSLIVISALVFAGVANAQIVPACPAGGCGYKELIQLGSNLIKFLVFFASGIAAVMFAYAGFLLVTSAGDEGKVKQAKQIFWHVVVGYIIVLAGWLIVDFVLDNIGVRDEFRKIGLIESIPMLSIAHAAVDEVEVIDDGGSTSTPSESSSPKSLADSIIQVIGYVGVLLVVIFLFFI